MVNEIKYVAKLSKKKERNYLVIKFIYNSVPSPAVYDNDGLNAIYSKN